MKPKLHVVTDVEGIKALHAYIQGQDILTFDCETTGVHKGAEIIGFSVCAEESPLVRNN